MITIGLVEPMRNSATVRCLLVSQGAERFTMGFKGVQGGFVIVHTQFRIPRHNLLVETNRIK
jgi:hypothetical protein